LLSDSQTPSNNTLTIVPNGETEWDIHAGQLPLNLDFLTSDFLERHYLAKANSQVRMPVAVEYSGMCR
jgi:hypothetical protein